MRARVSLSSSFCSASPIYSLSSLLPSINEPKKVLIAMKDKRRIFKEMNEGLREVRQRSFNESRDEWESMVKRTISTKKTKKKEAIKPLKSIYDLMHDGNPEPMELDVFWKVVSGDVGPGTRIGASLATTGESNVMLYGGETHMTLADSWLFSLSTLQWTPLYFQPRTPEARSGHTLTLFNRLLIVVGGEGPIPSYLRHRQLLPTVLALNAEESASNEVHTLNPYIGMRKFHCAVDSGRHILVHGGYGEKNEMLEDAAELNLVSLRWKVVRAEGVGPGPRAYHAGATVQWSAGVTEVGIYLFGGLDDQHHARDTLHLLKSTPRGWQWSQPHTSGEAPAARYQHTMVYMRDLLVVFGGRQDSHSDSGYRCFGELHILHLNCMQWTKAVLHGEPPENRCAHTAAAVGSKLVIFGGIHNNHFCSASIYIAELDKDKAERLIAEDERRKELLLRVEQFKLRNRLKSNARLPRKHMCFTINSSPICSPVPDLFTMLYQKVRSANEDQKLESTDGGV